MSRQQSQFLVASSVGIVVLIAFLVVLIRPTSTPPIDDPDAGWEPRVEQPRRAPTSSGRLTPTFAPGDSPASDTSELVFVEPDADGPNATQPRLPLVLDDLDTTAILLAVLAPDADTTTILGQDYLLQADGSLIELTPDLAAARREAAGRRDGDESNDSIEESDGGRGERPGEDEDEDAPEGEGMVTGRVLRGTRPIPEATLFLVRPGGEFGKRATTNRQGEFFYGGLAAGNYRLVLTEPSSPDSVRSVSLETSRSREQVDFFIPDFPPATGRVIDPSGDGVGDARLEAFQGAALRGAVTTNEQGFFQLFPLDPGTYRLASTAAGYRPAEVTFIIPTDRVPDEITITMDPTATIDGQVVSASGPVAGAWVGLFSVGAMGDPLTRYGTVTTDEAGRFRFSIPDTLPTGSFRVGSYRTGFVPAYGDSLSATSNLTGLTIFFPPGSQVTGRVLDRDDEPIDGAAISISSGFGGTAAIFERFNAPFPSAVAGVDGRFRIDAVETGPAVVTFAAEGFVSLDRSELLQSGRNDLGNVYLEGSEETRPDRIHGIVIDERGSPLVQHNILLRAEDGRNFSTRTDNRGGFRIDGLAAGVYTLFTNGSMLRGDLFVTMDQTVIDLRAGQPEVVVIYDFAQSIRLRVVNPQGEPVRSFRVRASMTRLGPSGSLGFQQKQTADFERVINTTDGRATIGTLLSGTVTLTITVDGLGVRELSPMALSVGGNPDIGTIEVGEGLTVSGSTIDDSGAPASGVLVRLYSPTGSTTAPFSLTTSSDGAGRWSISGVPVGMASIEASRAGLVRRVIEGIDPAAPTVPIVLQRAVTATGVVTDPSGRRLEGIEVLLGGLSVYTNGEGRFFADTVPVGPVSIAAFDPSGRYAPVPPINVTAVAGEVLTFDMIFLPQSP